MGIAIRGAAIISWVFVLLYLQGLAVAGESTPSTSSAPSCDVICDQIKNNEEKLNITNGTQTNNFSQVKAHCASLKKDEMGTAINIAMAVADSIAAALCVKSCAMPTPDGSSLCMKAGMADMAFDLLGMMMLSKGDPMGALLGTSRAEH